MFYSLVTKLREREREEGQSVNFNYSEAKKKIKNARDIHPINSRYVIRQNYIVPEYTRIAKYMCQSGGTALFRPRASPSNKFEFF